MSNIPAAGTGVGLFALHVTHPKQFAADVAATVHYVTCPVKGRVVRVVGVPGVHGGSTAVTDLDLTAYKNGTALNGTPIPAVDSSTLAYLEGAVDCAASVAACDIGDKFSVLYDCTGGSSPTVDGAGVIILIARE